MHCTHAVNSWFKAFNCNFACYAQRSISVNRRKICVVTTSRAEFGLLHGLLKCIQADPALRLQVIASGMHLARSSG